MVEREGERESEGGGQDAGMVYDGERERYRERDRDRDRDRVFLRKKGETSVRWKYLT